MICTLRDELMQRCQEITELEAVLSSVKQQVPSVVTKPRLLSFHRCETNYISVHRVFSHAEFYLQSQKAHKTGASQG